MPWYESQDLNERGRPNLTIWRIVADGAFHWVYADRVEFLISPDGGEVWCDGPEQATVADIAVYLRGPILSLVLRLKGVLCLHASAIAVGDSSIAIVGPAGAGKSTTAAGLVSLGCALMSDDVTALDVMDGRFHTRPGYPWLNLWPDAGDTLYGDGAALGRVTPLDGISGWWDKRYVPCEAAGQFERRTLPLTAVYVLDGRSAEATAPRVQPVRGQDAFLWLTHDTSANYAMDPSMRAKEFQALGDLVRTTPVRHVTPHRDPARLLDLCAAILDDCREQSAMRR